ncbi:uracil DNA glycosylase [Cryptotrichosporon argae]
MPPSITSYFKPVPSNVSPTASASASASTSAAKPGGTSTTPSKPSLPKPPLISGSKAGLSAAAKRAILEGVEESPVKKAKTVGGALGLKPSVPATLKLPHCATRDELRAAVEAHPAIVPLLELELETMGEDWLLTLQAELTKPYFLALKEFVMAEQKSKKVFPPAEDIYSWSRLCPLKDVRIVIIGQDPYHDDNQAHGLAFSVRKGIRIPPSLRNIYKEMADEVPGFVVPKHGDLTVWAEHGVLLLNTSLTVRAHEAGSHAARGWDQFTAAVLRTVVARLAPGADDIGDGGQAHGVVLLVWGAHAAKMVAGTDGKKHCILKSAHPSPLSASRGFFGNGHFNKANAWLEERYGVGGGIDWKALGA